MLYTTFTIAEDREQHEDFDRMGISTDNVHKEKLMVQFNMADVKSHMENTVTIGEETHKVTVVFFYDMSSMVILEDPYEFAEVRKKYDEGGDEEETLKEFLYRTIGVHIKDDIKEDIENYKTEGIFDKEKFVTFVKDTIEKHY